MSPNAHHQHHHAHHGDIAPVTRSAAAERGRLKAIRDTAGAVIGAVLSLVPHVLHHIGLLVGAALITGAAGNALFYAVGLVFSLPMLLRLYRRFRTPWAPAIAVAIFTGLFSLSAFVIGPAISGTGDEPASTRPVEPGPAAPSANHNEHHE